MKSFIQTRDIDDPKKIGLVTKMYVKCLTTTTLFIIVSHAKDDKKKLKKKIKVRSNCGNNQDKRI